ncbi:MAG: LamG-like jellyroll fold domain-containing protein, partial [Geminicoccaceae bacterium]
MVSYQRQKLGQIRSQPISRTTECFLHNSSAEKQTKPLDLSNRNNCSANFWLYILRLFSIYIGIVFIYSDAYAEDLDSGLIKYVTFDEQGIDYSKINGKIVPGKFGAALKLERSRDYFDLGDLSVMEDYKFTIGFWYKSDNGRGWVFSEGNSSNNVAICGLVFSNRIKMFCRSSAASSMKRIRTISYAINDNRWHHVALTGDGNQMSIYIDGLLLGSMSLPELKPSFNMTSLGRLGRRNSTAYVKATFDDVRIYDRPLSLSAIRNLSKAPVIAKEAEPVASSISIPAHELPTPPLKLPTQAPILATEAASFEFPEANLTALFGKVPRPGVHPRILFGPAQLPAIRSRIRNSGSGKRAYGLLKRTADRLRKGELSGFYSALKSGDRNALKKIKSCFWRDKARMVMSYEAFIILIEDIRGSRTSDFTKALTTFAQITGGFYKKDVCRWLGDDHYALADLAYAYDFVYGKLSARQRSTIRQAVTAKLSKRRGYGMDLHRNDRIAPPNFQMHGMSHYILNLAFEGQPGFSESLNAKSESLAWDFLKYEIHADGTPREGMHYFHFGMEHGAEALIAMSRRGHNIINHQNYRRMLNWYIYSVEPYGYKFSTHGDTIRQDGGLMDNYTLLKYVWSNNTLFDYAWRHRMGDNYERFNQLHDYLMPAIFGANLKSVSKNATSLNLPLAFHSEDRGFSVARSSWDPDALSLHFSSRTDLHTTGHYHSDHNDFTLSARGRNWVKDWGYHSYRDYQHNLVRIDGRGQGYFPAFGTFPKFIHNDIITVSVGDAKYAYTYRWVHKSRKGASGYKKHSWQLDPNVNPIERSNTTWRSKWNPVQMAFRTVSWGRGSNPYVLVIDDIKKDNKSRLYE